MALCYYKLDYYDVSLEILAAYLQAHPDSAMALNLKACNQFRLYDGKAAEAEGTRALLRGWAARNRHVRVVLAQPLRYPAWSRTQRLALCRNVLLGEALATLPPSGVLVQFDLDCQVPAPATLLGALRSMIGPAPAWDVVTSNSPAGQFWCAA